MRSSLVLLLTLVACGGTQQEPVKPFLGPGSAAAPTPTKPVASGDVSFEIPAVEIKGTVAEPSAMGRPGMPLVEAKKKTTADKQRALVQSTKDPVLKQAQAAILATILYLESKANKANEKQLLTDARQVLRDVAQLAGDKDIDEVTLRLLGSYEIILEDYPAAEKSWAGLIAKDPKSKELPYSRAWLAYAQLKQFKNADALATVNADKLDDKQPELAYVTAWARLRSGDGAGAWQAILVAAKGWGQNTGREDLEREILWLAARANIPADQVAAAVQAMPGKAKLQQYELLAKLGLSGYGIAGRWAYGIAALEKAVEVAGADVPANDLMVIRYQQADFTVKLDDPDAASAYAKRAIEAANACAKCAARDKSDIVQGVYLMGRLFHILYATANDRRYHQPAHDLYALTIPMLTDAATKTTAEKDAKTLAATLKNTKAGTGTHDKGALSTLFARHNSELQTCYEAVLGANPKLGGTVTVQLESDATGAVKGVTTEPKAGLADLSAVADCAAKQIATWKLPKRGMAGNTRIKLSYAFSIKK